MYGPHRVYSIDGYWLVMGPDVEYGPFGTHREADNLAYLLNNTVDLSKWEA